MESEEIKLKNNIKFNPIKKEILSDTEDISVIYSEWKRWVLTGNNSMFFPAFENIEGEIKLNEDWSLVYID